MNCPMNTDLEQRILEYAERHGMFTTCRGGTVLAALSGGGDSVALAALLHRLADRLGIVVEAAHLNHALRDTESDGDEAFCRDFCARLGIPLTVERLEPGSLESAGESLETAARNARLAFLARIADSRGAVRIATGHTADDQSETVLMRIIRGTGPAGISGIAPIRDGLWVRPLLGLTRHELEVWLETSHITFRHDSSNDDTRFVRNRVRHELLPYIRDHFGPGADDALVRLAGHSRLQEDFLAGTTEQAFSDCLAYAGPGKILLEKGQFGAYHTLLQQRMVRYALALIEGKGRGTTGDEVERILNAFGRAKTTLTLGKLLRFGTGGDIAVFTQTGVRHDSVPLAPSGQTVIPDNGFITLRRAARGTVVDGRTTVLIDPGLADRYGPFTVGPLRRGESMVPFGMDSPVKIRDLAAARAVPRVLRDELTVVRAGVTPLWVPGLRAAELVRLPVDEHGSTITDGALHATVSGWYAAL